MISIAAFPKCWLEELSDGRRDLFDWIEQSAQLACDGLELYSEFLTSHEPSYLADVRRRVERLGMTVPMICYSPDFTIPEPELRLREIEKQKAMIRVTAALGGTFCRTLSGQARPDVAVDTGVDWVVACIEACLGEAQRCGVTLVMENHFKDGYWEYREFAQTKDVFLRVIDRIDSPHFGVQYDPSNALVAGDDPLDVLDAIVSHVRTMHASDRYLLPGVNVEDMRQADGTLGCPESLVHGVTGEGANDYDGILSRLAAVGFDGWISIEDGVNGMEEMAQSVEFLKRMRAKYFPA